MSTVESFAVGNFEEEEGVEDDKVPACCFSACARLYPCVVRYGAPPSASYMQWCCCANDGTHQRLRESVPSVANTSFETPSVDSSVSFGLTSIDSSVSFRPEYIEIHVGAKNH